MAKKKAKTAEAVYCFWYLNELGEEDNYETLCGRQDVSEELLTCRETSSDRFTYCPFCGKEIQRSKKIDFTIMMHPDGANTIKGHDSVYTYYREHVTEDGFVKDGDKKTALWKFITDLMENK